MRRRKNVLFVIIDQLRADCVYGALAEKISIPNIRALMDEAVSFTRHYSVTSPCGPSRASILTGRYAINHRSVRNGTPLAQDTPTIATEVRKAGYLPLLYGYTDTSPDPRGYDAGDPFLSSYEQVAPGFVEAVEMRLEESWPWRADLIEKGYDPPPYPEIFRPQGARLDDPAFYRKEDSDTAFLTRKLISDLRARPPGWFAHLTYIRPHPPFVAPDPYNRMYDPASLPPPVTPLNRDEARAAHPFTAPAMDAKPFAGMVEAQSPPEENPENIATIRAIYAGLITEVDHHLGEVIAALKEMGQYEDTLIILTADHGEMLGDHHLWGKLTYHDAAFHTPLIIRDPELREAFGARVDEITELVDIAPTMLDLLGLETPHTMDGRTLRPFLEGRAPETWRDYSFSEADYGNPLKPTLWQERLGLEAEACNLSVLRGRRYSLTHFNGALPQILFDHEAEGEGRDISSAPGAAEIMLQMSRRMLDHRMSFADGRFARTMLTPEGAQKTPNPRHGGPPS